MYKQLCNKKINQVLTAPMSYGKGSIIKWPSTEMENIEGQYLD